MKNRNVVSEPMVAYGTIISGDVNTFIQKVRKGIAFSVFSHVASLMSFSISEWASFLHLSDRSMQRYKKEQKRFDALQSEKIIEISLLQNRGSEIFGSAQKFDQWLSTSSVALGSNTPKSFLDSSFGIQLINDELGRIEHGILA